MNDQALITLTGEDFVMFKVIHQKFKYYNDHCTPFTEDGTIQMIDGSILQGQVD
jgi:hypothetical protein